MSLAKVNKFSEIFWWTMAIISLIMVVIFTIQDGFEKWGFYFIIPAISVLMALTRRFMKNKLEKSEKFKS